MRRHLSNLVEGISGIRYKEKHRSMRDGDFYLIATVNGVQNDDSKRMEEHFRNVLAAMEAKEVRT